MKFSTLSLRALCFLLLVSLGTVGTGRAQSWRWAQAVTTGSGGSPLFVAASGTDSNGNTVVAGNFYGTLQLGATTLVATGPGDLFVARLSPTGQWLQAVRAGGSHTLYATALAVDGNGGVVITGNFGTGIYPVGATATFGSTTLSSTGQYDIFVARLSMAGVWTQAFALGTPQCAATPRAIAVDGVGNAAVVGDFSSGPGGSFQVGATTLNATSRPDIFVARLSAAGQWTQAIQAEASNGIADVYPRAAAFDAAGNLVVAGFFNATFQFGTTPRLTSAGSTDAFVARLNPGGQWVQAVRAGGSDIDQIQCLALDGAGNAVVGGVFGNDPGAPTATFGNISLTSAGGADIFVARLSAAGTWTQAVRAGGPNGDAATALALDGAGNVVVAGGYGENYPFTTSLATTASFGSINLSSTGGASIFVARLGSAGWDSALSASGTFTSFPNAVSVGPAGDATVTGGFVSTASFGPFALAGSSAVSSFVARLGGLVTATRATSSAEIFTLAPNPATAQVHLSWPEATAAPRSVQILDGLGRQVRQQVLPAHTTSAVLDVQSLPPGLYLVRCGAATGQLVVE